MWFILDPGSLLERKGGGGAPFHWQQAWQFLALKREYDVDFENYPPQELDKACLKFHVHDRTVPSGGLWGMGNSHFLSDQAKYYFLWRKKQNFLDSSFFVSVVFSNSSSDLLEAQLISQFGCRLRHGLHKVFCACFHQRTRQKITSCWRLLKNRIEQCCAAHIVQCC